MTEIQTNLGIQSYCFRHVKENAQVIEKLQACGVKNIELCGVHADFSNESTFDDVIKQYADAGVGIVSIGVQGMNDEAAKERKYFEFAKRAGAKFMSVTFGISSVPGSLETAEKLAEEFDIKLAIHNHGGSDWLGNATTLREILSRTSNRIGLCMDTAWAIDARANPLKWVEEFGDRLYGLHIKDFIFNRAGKGEDVVVGTGNLDLPALLKAVKTANFDGFCVLEYEGDVENPVPALTECVAAVRNA